MVMSDGEKGDRGGGGWGVGGGGGWTPGASPQLGP